MKTTILLWTLLAWWTINNSSSEEFRAFNPLEGERNITTEVSGSISEIILWENSIWVVANNPEYMRLPNNFQEDGKNWNTMVLRSEDNKKDLIETTIITSFKCKKIILNWEEYKWESRYIQDSDAINAEWCKQAESGKTTYNFRIEWKELKATNIWEKTVEKSFQERLDARD